MDFKVEYQLTLNDEVVAAPVEIITYSDPLGLAESIDLNLGESHQVKLLSLKATQNLKWLEKALKLPDKYLKIKTNLRKFRLIQEIHDAVEDTKKDLRRTSKWALLLLHIRNRNLFVQNRTDCVIVGLVGVAGGSTSEDEKETLQWITKQLHQDLEFVLDPAGQVPGGCWKRSEIWGTYEDEITQIVENLKKHPQCMKATWVPSRRSFKVQNSKACKFFRVSNLRQRDKASVILEDVFGQVESQCLEFLENSPSASSGPAIVEEEEEAIEQSQESAS